MLKYKRVGLTVKSGLDDKCEAIDHIVSILQSLSVEVYMDPNRLGGIECAVDLPQYTKEEDIDLLLAIGGDGTILRVVREFQQWNIPIVTVNRGMVGFLAEVEFDEAEEILPKLLSGEGNIDERNILSVQVIRNGKTVIDGMALNEAVIAQGMIARLVDLKTSVNGESLTTFHADGLIVATPTGSTAYSLSAGGPIVHPSLAATILTPINPHSFSQKPVIIRSDASVEIEVLTKKGKHKDTDVILTMDGQVYQSLECEDIVTITNDNRSIKFLRREGDTFFHTLREKLKWGERLES